MLAAKNYESLVNQLGEAFDKRYQGKPENFATAIVLCRPESSFTQKEILPHLEYLDRTSSNYVDFFFIGYTAHAVDTGKPENTVARNMDSWWTFSIEEFKNFEDALEKNSKNNKLAWRYSGEVDILIMNAIYHNDLKQAELGFENIIALNVEKALKDETFSSFSNLVTELTKILESQPQDNPVSYLSDQIAIKLIGRSFWVQILNLLPFKLGDYYKKLQHFAIK